ncbi:hypothetical protein [Rubellimicrobium roseum]|uniref:DUF1127 domain-containing protein n=1 Tax=Rubellimicrobium roseum TaxID=687525 RepID=A0A5C4NC02_9RHOB|nr:hypothetical protein [Rubellimicrobium roseum]TNC71410.1 hypothetical protein FHG71_11690 [Rubellimicrobium roseum]
MQSVHGAKEQTMVVPQRGIAHMGVTGRIDHPVCPRMNMSLITHLRSAMGKRAAYRRTLQELRGIPAHLADDLNIQPGDVERLAHQAVYG